MRSDRRINGGCSRKRPDIFVDFFTHVLIVEVDEHQHKRNYDTSCEHRRQMELFEDAGNLPMVILRFNPHKYVNRSGQTVRTPWTRDGKTNKPHVKPDRKGEWQARLQVLFKRIAFWAQYHDIPDMEVTEEKLFYDGL